MANIVYTPPEGWVEKTGSTIAFTAPCGCTEATAIQIGTDGNIYSFVDENGDVLTGADGKFKKGQLVEAILNVDELKAYVCKETANTVFMAGLLNALHPVGSLYWSRNATDPSQLFGGKWTRIKDKFILAAGDDYEAGTEGGEAEHKLDIKEIPSVSFNIPHVAGFNQEDATGYTGHNIEHSYIPNPNNYEGAAHALDSAVWHHLVFGGNQPHNNMPPYIAFYCWERTE